MNWTVLTVNPQGRPLPQPAIDFEQAWLLAKPPNIKQWTTKTKEEVEAMFAEGCTYAYVALHKDGTIRMIHRDL